MVIIGVELGSPHPSVCPSACLSGRRAHKEIRGITCGSEHIWKKKKKKKVWINKYPLIKVR